MKISLRSTIVLSAFTLGLPAAADTIYSNLLNTPIPTDFTGVSVTVDGGTINPFFGGVGVANDGLFQPIRDGTGNLDTIQNLAVGSLIDASQLFSTGSGGSQDHLGTTFTAGQEGFIGFKTGAGNYGWMRVVFTGNTSGAVIKDWAYDDSGAAINVGRIQQSTAVEGAQLVTLSPGIGESFTLGTQIADTGGNVNSVLKTGAGTTVLTGSNTHTGTTTIDQGKLVVNGSISNSAVTVNNAGSVLASGVTGTIGASLTVNDGAIVAAGDAGTAGTATVSGEATFNSGSIFSWDISADGASYDKLVANSLAGDGDAVFRIVVADELFSDAFWNQTRTWENIFTTAGEVAITDWASLFQISVVNSSFETIAPVSGSFGLAGSTLTWSAVPEPTSALAGLLIAAGLLRRRRA